MEFERRRARVQGTSVGIKAPLPSGPYSRDQKDGQSAQQGVDGDAGRG